MDYSISISRTGDPSWSGAVRPGICAGQQHEGSTQVYLVPNPQQVAAVRVVGVGV